MPKLAALYNRSLALGCTHLQAKLPSWSSMRRAARATRGSTRRGTGRHDDDKQHAHDQRQRAPRFRTVHAIAAYLGQRT